MSDADRQRKKEYMKNYYYKRKNLLNNLIDHVDKLENVCLNNYVHKTYFLNY